MARMERSLWRNKEYYVHIMSYTAGRQKLLHPKAREKLYQVIEKYSRLFFVEVIGVCIMDNHFHLLVKMKKDENYSNEEIIRRLIEHYGEEKYKEKYSHKPMEYFRNWLSSISEYVKMIKQTYSVWYNKTHNRIGTLWGDRFKSAMIGEGNGLLVCMSYIDMNPVRKGWLKNPGEYRWSRYGRFLRNPSGIEDAIYTYEGTGMKNIMEYSDFLDYYGRQDRSFQGKKGKVEGKTSLRDLLLEKLLTRGVAVGSKEFIGKSYIFHQGNQGLTKKERTPHPTGIEGLYSLRNIKL